MVIAQRIYRSPIEAFSKGRSTNQSTTKSQILAVSPAAKPITDSPKQNANFKVDGDYILKYPLYRQ